MGPRGGSQGARFLLPRYPRVSTTQDPCQREWGQAPLPMVRERRGRHPTVIGNPHLPTKREGPHPTPSLLLLSLRRSFTSDDTACAPPSTGRPHSTSSISHIRHHGRACSRSVRSAARQFRRAARLPARSSTDHVICLNRLEEKKERIATVIAQHASEDISCCDLCSYYTSTFYDQRSICASGHIILH